MCNRNVWHRALSVKPGTFDRALCHRHGILGIMLPSQYRLLVRWKPAIASAVIASFISLILIFPGSTLADDQTYGKRSEGVGVHLASWALTIPYIVGKSAFALTGAIVGGMGYVFSAGNQETAKAVWTTSICGTYIIRPAHLRGQEPVHFLGTAEEAQSESLHPSSQPAPQTTPQP